MRLVTSLRSILLLAGLICFLVPAAQADHIIWHSPLNHSTVDDLTLRPYYNTSALVLFPMPQVTGSFNVQFLLTLPSNVEIDAITICYRGFTTLNWISRIELNQMTGPMAATIIHEEAVHLDHTNETCYTSVVGGVPVEGTVTLTLDFEFGYPYDSILLGAIGVHVSEAVSDVGADWQPADQSRLVLQQNKPNPFVPPTLIEYTLAQAGEVSAEVLDVTGRIVQTLFQGAQSEGAHRVSWDGTGESGEDMPAGRYYYRVRAGEEVVSGGMMMLR